MSTPETIWLIGWLFSIPFTVPKEDKGKLGCMVVLFLIWPFVVGLELRSLLSRRP